MIITKNEFFIKYYFGKKYSVLAPKKGIRAKKDVRYFPQRITRMQMNFLLKETFRKSFDNLAIKSYNIKIHRLTPNKITIFYKSYYTQIDLFIYKNQQLNSSFKNIEDLIEKCVSTMNEFIIEIDEKIRNW